MGPSHPPPTLGVNAPPEETLVPLQLGHPPLPCASLPLRQVLLSFLASELDFCVFEVY